MRIRSTAASNDEYARREPRVPAWAASPAPSVGCGPGELGSRGRRRWARMGWGGVLRPGRLQVRNTTTLMTLPRGRDAAGVEVATSGPHWTPSRETGGRREGDGRDPCRDDRGVGGTHEADRRVARGEGAKPRLNRSDRKAVRLKDPCWRPISPEYMGKQDSARAARPATPRPGTSTPAARVQALAAAGSKVRHAHHTGGHDAVGSSRRRLSRPVAGVARRSHRAGARGDLPHRGAHRRRRHGRRVRVHARLSQPFAVKFLDPNLFVTPRPTDASVKRRRSPRPPTTTTCCRSLTSRSTTSAARTW